MDFKSRYYVTLKRETKNTQRFLCERWKEHKLVQTLELLLSNTEAPVPVRWAGGANAHCFQRLGVKKNAQCFLCSGYTAYMLKWCYFGYIRWKKIHHNSCHLLLFTFVNIATRNLKLVYVAPIRFLLHSTSPEQGSANFFLKGQVVNSFSFVDQEAK